jgi:hypothetical protein
MCYKCITQALRTVSLLSIIGVLLCNRRVVTNCKYNLVRSTNQTARHCSVFSAILHFLSFRSFSKSLNLFSSFSMRNQFPPPCNTRVQLNRSLAKPRNSTKLIFIAPTNSYQTLFSLMFRAVFWVVLPCKMIVDRRFRGTYWIRFEDSFKTRITLHTVLVP